MSGPVRDVDASALDPVPLADLDHVEVREGRTAEVGGLGVVRVLPTKGRRTVGPWCFVDLLGPVDADVDDPDPLEVGPHPHIGLATVTWLLDGEALHTDSLGTEQVIRPGQLNLMTAGHGIAHAELSSRPPFRGAQLWLAQPDATRDGDATFQHLAVLPEVRLTGTRDRRVAASGSAAEATPGRGGAVGTVLVGTLDGADGPVTSAARVDTPTLGADLVLAPGITVVPLDPWGEYVVVPLDGTVRVGPEVVGPGWIALVPRGADEVPLAVRGTGARVLLLGGHPLGEPIAMWWNFVARDREELTAAWRDWDTRSERFGPVASPLARIPAPAPPWVRPSA